MNHIRHSTLWWFTTSVRVITCLIFSRSTLAFYDQFKCKEKGGADSRDAPHSTATCHSAATGRVQVCVQWHSTGILVFICFWWAIQRTALKWFKISQEKKKYEQIPAIYIIQKLALHSLHWYADSFHSFSAILCAWQWTAVTASVCSSTGEQQTVSLSDHPRATCWMTWDMGNAKLLLQGWDEGWEDKKRSTGCHIIILDIVVALPITYMWQLTVKGKQYCFAF